MKTQELPEEEASAATAPATAPEKEQSSRTLEGLQDSTEWKKEGLQDSTDFFVVTGNVHWSELR